MTDTILQSPQIYKDLYTTLTQVSNRDKGTTKSQKETSFFLEKFHNLNQENRVSLSLIMSSSKRMSFEAYFTFDLLSENPVSIEGYTSALDIWSIRYEKMSQHWAQKPIRDIPGASLIQMEYAKLIYGSKEDKEKLQKDSAKKKSISRLFEPYIGKGIDCKKGKGNGYAIKDWSFFRQAVLGAIQDKVGELVGRTRLEDDLFQHNPISKLARDIEHNKGFCEVDINKFTDINLDFIRENPQNAIDDIRELILKHITLTDEQQRSLLVRLDYNLQEDSFDDIFHLENKKLLCFEGNVIFKKKVKIRNGHLFANVSVQYNGTSVSPTLSSMKGSVYLKQSEIQAHREYSGPYKVVAIVKQVVKDVKDEYEFELDIMSMKIPPAEVPIPNPKHIEKYLGQIKEVGFDKNFSNLLATVPLEGRELMVKCTFLSLVSNYEDEETYGESDRALNTLIIGDPGQGKSQLMKWIRAHIGCANYIPCEASSKTIVSRVVEEGGNRRLVKGPFAEDQGEYILADEFQTIDSESYNQILNLIDTGETNIKKYCYNVTFYSRRPVVAMGNPMGQKVGIDRSTQFDLTTPLSDQFGLTENILRRFDLRVAVTRADLDPETKLTMNKNVWLRKYNTKSHDCVYTPEEFCSIFWYVKAFTSKFDKEELRKSIKWANQNSHLVSHAVQRVAKQFAKFRLSPIVEVEDLARARETFTETVETHHKRSML